MPTAMDVAQYFLAVNSPSSLTDLKLQKLCSYAQAVSIAYLGKKLFNDVIEMWELGPVVPSVYQKYRQYARDPIPSTSLNLSKFTEQERFVLAAVNDFYSKPFDAWGLCEQSHRDFPGVRGGNMILEESILRQAFKDACLVEKMRRSDCEEPQTPGATLSEQEFWNAVSN